MELSFDKVQGNDYMPMYYPLHPIKVVKIA